MLPISYGFYESAQRFSENIAIYVQEKYYTYREVWQIVKNIAICIEKNNLPPHSRIAVLDNADIYTYSALLAVSLTGHTYIPLNRKFPTIRNTYILQTTQASLLLSSENFEQTEKITGLGITNTPFVFLEEGFLNKYAKEEPTWVLELDAKSIAYILFTSGSTGTPKGVPVRNESVWHFFRWHWEAGVTDFSPNDRFLQVYDLSFDVSVFSFFMPLSIGASTYIVPNTPNKHLEIANYLAIHRITVLSMVPSVLNFLAPYFEEMSFPYLRYSEFSGDALWQDIAEKWANCLPNGQIINFYGPTETTIYCTYYIWEKERSRAESYRGIVPIGHSFEGMQAIIIDEKNEIITAINTIGELCYAGKMVIDNYWNREHEDKFLEIGGMRYYRTGDLVSLHNRGFMVFHGRTDSQVKIAGYRVELGEIEYRIREIVGKDSIVAVLVIYQQGNPFLYACIEGTEWDKKQLRQSLTKYLPTYMMPHFFYPIPHIPMNTNGKIDKLALRELIKI